LIEWDNGIVNVKARFSTVYQEVWGDIGDFVDSAIDTKDGFMEFLTTLFLVLNEFS